MKVKVSIILFAIFILSSIKVQAAENTFADWQGIYRFGGIFGRDRGGVTITYDLVLTIFSNGNCKVHEDGYQIMSRTDCKISKNSQGIDIVAQNCSKDDLGPCGYRLGDRMFSLISKNNGVTLTTVWGKLKPEGYVKSNSGAYLKREKPIKHKKLNSITETTSDKKTKSYPNNVANYSIGIYGKKGYEQFSFWTKNNKRNEINYCYGKCDKEITLTYLGTEILNGEPCFKVRFPNDYVLYITPKGKSLKVVDSTSKYSNLFKWEYEGPVDGIGTFCEACTSEKESSELIRQYFTE